MTTVTLSLSKSGSPLKPVTACSKIGTCGNDAYINVQTIMKTDKEALEVFKIADVVVPPHKKSFHAQSSVLNLAIGYEKPCIVSDVGGIGETVRRYDLGIVVEPESISELKEGIPQLHGRDIL